MDTALLQPYKSLLPPPQIHRRITVQNPRHRSLIIPSVLAGNNLDASTAKLAGNNLDELTAKSSYNDSWFDRLGINHLSKSLQAATGLRSEKTGYDGLVEAATMASRRFGPVQQRLLVIKTLETAFPSPILFVIKTLLPPSKFAREYFATFTTIFFAWLVGPCQVKESEFEGRREKNVVYVPKCRFLEETNCVGMCTNLCKMPSQSFIKESLGVPITMVPNFDDMSCEMIFGQEPPEQTLDPAFSQPCYKQCKALQRHERNCTN